MQYITENLICQGLWYFHLEVDYFSNQMNKYKSFQLIASKKENNLKVADEQIAQIIYLQQQL